MARLPRLAILLAPVFLAACGSSAPPPPSPAPTRAAPISIVSAAGDASAAKLGVNSPLNLAYAATEEAFLWQPMAYKQGLFQKHGVSVSPPALMADQRRLLDGIVDGSLDAAGMHFDTVIEADASGADLEAIAAIGNYASESLVLPPGSAVKTPRDLKGRAVAVGDPIADELLSLVLDQNGLARGTDVKVVSARSKADALAAALGGKADAAAVSSADAFAAQAKGAIVLTNSKQVQQLRPQGPLIVRRTWATAHRPQVVGLLQAMLEATSKYRASQDAGVRELQDSGWFNGVPPDVLGAIWRDDIANWIEVPYVNAGSAGSAVQAESRRNPALRSEPLPPLYDNSYLQQLVTSGFLKSLYSTPAS